MLWWRTFQNDNVELVALWAPHSTSHSQMRTHSLEPPCTHTSPATTVHRFTTAITIATPPPRSNNVSDNHSLLVLSIQQRWQPEPPACCQKQLCWPCPHQAYAAIHWCQPGLAGWQSLPSVSVTCCPGICDICPVGAGAGRAWLIVDILRLTHLQHTQQSDRVAFERQAGGAWQVKSKDKMAVAAAADHSGTVHNLEQALTKTPSRSRCSYVNSDNSDCLHGVCKVSRQRYAGNTRSVNTRPTCCHVSWNCAQNLARSACCAPFPTGLDMLDVAPAAM